MNRKTKFRIRRAQFADASALAELSRQLGYEATAKAIRARLRNTSRLPGDDVFVGESHEHQVVGWIHVHTHRVLENEPCAEIGGLVVDHEWRGAGVGSALLARAERWARSKRLASVYLRSNVKRKGAHAFYLKRGYRIIKTQHAFRKTF